MPTAEENTVERNFRPRIGKQVSVLYRDGTLQAGAFLSLSGSKTGPKWKKTEAPDQNFPLSESTTPLASVRIIPDPSPEVNTSGASVTQP